MFLYVFQNEVKRHNFFASINWDDLEQKKISPPFNPNVVGSCSSNYITNEWIIANDAENLINILLSQDSSYDITNFDPEFTDETVPNSVCYSAEHSIVNASVMEADDAFLGFSYAPPSDDSFL